MIEVASSRPKTSGTKLTDKAQHYVTNKFVKTVFSSCGHNITIVNLSTVLPILYVNVNWIIIFLFYC